MTLIKYKPVTSSLRHKVLVLKSFDQLQKNESKVQGGQEGLQTDKSKEIRQSGRSKKGLKDLRYHALKLTPPIKKLLKGLLNNGGRNNRGKATLITQGGGHKKLYRIVDFKRRAFDQPAIVLRKEYDPNRSSFIASILYKDSGVLSYILAPENLEIGRSVISSLSPVPIEVGNTSLLVHLPEGSFIHNIEIRPGQGGKLVRSAGNYAQLLKKQFDSAPVLSEDKKNSPTSNLTTETAALNLETLTAKGRALLKLRSGFLLYLPLTCLATLGSLSNPDHQNEKYGKAGRSIWLNKRPHVRGVAKNPVDHPHGGGQGKTSGGRPSVTPKGWPTKGRKTRKYFNPFVQIPRGKA